MTDEPENLVLIFLRRIDQRQERMEQALGEVLTRLSRLEEGQARVRRDQAVDAETVTHLQAQLDRYSERLERIERRLDIGDA